MTTGESAAEEMPWNFERKPEPATQEVTIETGKKVWRFDGLLDRWLAKAREGLEARQHEGPPRDYAEDEDDDIRRLAGIIERLAQRPPDNGYHEGPKPDSSLKTIIITCTASILTAGVIGGIILSNEFAALRAEVTEWKISTDRRLEALERRP